jgi:hypothetical protein
MINQTFPASCPTVCFNGLSLLVSIRETSKNRNNQQNTACLAGCGEGGLILLVQWNAKPIPPGSK